MIAAILLLAPIISGCPPSVMPYRSEGGVTRSYKIGETQTIAPGGTIAAARTLTNAPMYEVAFDYDPPQHDLFSGGLDYPPLKKGMRFIQVATRSDDLIGIEREGYGVSRAAKFTNRDTYLPVTIWISSDGIVSTSMEGRSWTRDMLFLPLKLSTAPVTASRWELIFSSSDGTLIDATFNEYEGDATTPVTSRPVRFSIAESKTIEHRGMSIEVLSATSTSLEFKVIGDAN